MKKNSSLYLVMDHNILKCVSNLVQWQWTCMVSSYVEVTDGESDGVVTRHTVKQLNLEK